MGLNQDNSNDVIGILADLVRINSVNPAYHDGVPEAAMAAYIQEFFEKRGIEVSQQTVAPGRPNVLARLPGRDPSRRIVFEAHTDTAGISGMTIPPFEPCVRDGRLYGRGSCDTKGGVAAMMSAIASLAADRIQPRCEVVFAGTADEEFSFQGVIKLCDGLRADAAVVAEPTSLRLIVATKGVLRFRIRVQGKAAHSAKPHLGVNAVSHMARLIVAQGKVLGGLAIIEDAREQTAALVALPPEAIGGAGEARLLARSKALMARLPFEQIDVLVVDELGKNISGTGMDTKVIGRLPIPGEPPLTSPVIKVIVVLDLTKETHGNANGMGLADLTTLRLASKIDFHATYINVLTAGLVGLCKGGMPVALPTAHDAIATALKVCGQTDPANARLVRIKNTLQLEELLVTAALLPEVEAHPGLELHGPAAWADLV